MNFDMNSLASSSSSSDSSTSQSEGENDDSSDHEVDENLAYEIRSALHLTVGNICRAEENTERRDADSGSRSDSSPTCTMSKEAIVALTDLTYHYSTSLLANDLVSFSKHAKRQTVKTDDVLLVARKDKRGMLSELKKIIADNPDVYTEGAKKKKSTKAKSNARSKSNSGTTTAGKKSGKGNDKSNQRSDSKKSKGTTKRGKKQNSRIRSSSSSSSSSSSEDEVIKMRRNKQAQRKRESLNKKGKKSGFISKGAAKGRDTGSDLEDFIANDDTEDYDKSNSSLDADFGIKRKKKSSGSKKKQGKQKGGGHRSSSFDSSLSSKRTNGSKKKEGKQKSGNRSFDLTNSDDSDDNAGRKGGKKLFRIDGESEDNNMVIDLAGD